MSVPRKPKVYHIVHVDRLASIAADGFLWSDAVLQQCQRQGTVIGMTEIKHRRLTNPVRCHRGLKVGGCVPFYFCPRSVMLYVIHMANHSQLDYRGGQDPIVHLQVDLHKAVRWADRNRQRWAFTLQNAAVRYVQARCNLAQLDEIDWNAVQARAWRSCSESKQAEFLVEYSFPWQLVRRIGARTAATRDRARDAISRAVHQPRVRIRRDWYY